MTSSDERREVAARLREDASCSESSPRDVVESYLGIEYDGADVLEESYTSESLLHIADLIDPTCHIVLRQRDSDFTDEPHYMCSRCGKEGIDVFERRDYTLAGIVSHAPYCSQCGARVTGGGEG